MGHVWAGSELSKAPVGLWQASMGIAYDDQDKRALSQGFLTQRPVHIGTERHWLQIATLSRWDLILLLRQNIKKTDQMDLHR